MILIFHKSFFSNNGFFFNALGKIDAYYNNKDFDFNLIKNHYKCDYKLRYKSSTNSYSLFVPKKMIAKNHISLDPGIRTFMTGLSNDSIFKIAHRPGPKIKKYLYRLDNAKQIKNNYKRKREINLCERKLTNLVNDLIKYINSKNCMPKIFKF